MRKIIALPLVFCSFASFADLAPTTDIQPYPEYLAAYVKTLMIAGCEQTLTGGSEDVLIERAAQGMKKILRVTALYITRSSWAQAQVKDSKRKGG